jgi:parvulin-like peptidyl-prolyl isomerase
MKITLIFPLFAVGLFAQAVTQTPQTPPPASPLMGRPDVSRPQPGTPSTPPSPDKEVAKLNGKPLTVADVEKLLADIPAQFQMYITHEPEKFLPQLMVYEQLEKEAEEAGIDKQSPLRQELAYNRLMTLARAEIERFRNTAKLTPEQEQQYYDANKAVMFRVVKAKVILIGFAPAAAAPMPPGVPKPSTPPAPNGVTRTEADAKAKIEDLRKQILAGADFGKLAKENSDDKTSAAKDGDYGDIMRSSPYPEPIKKAIFDLKPGEVSEPIRQPTGFYLIKAADSSFQPLDQVRAQIRSTLLDEELHKHIDAVTAQFNVTVEDKAYFTTRPPH